MTDDALNLEFDEYYSTNVPIQLGFLLGIDVETVEEAANKQYDAIEGLAEDREKMTMKLNKSDKCTLSQLKRIIKKIEDVGLVLEQNKSKENPKLYFIRISCSETELMKSAQSMGLKKRLKPITVPTLEGKKRHGFWEYPVVEGGYISYSLCRADAFKNQDLDIYTSLNSAIPPSERGAAVGYKKDDDDSDDHLPCIYTKLCPEERMPFIPGTQIHMRHDNYPGIFEKPDPRDSTPDSLFTDEERLNIIMWKLETLAGFDISINEKTGKGKIEFWTPPKENSIGSGGVEAMEAVGGDEEEGSSRGFCWFKSEEKKPTTGTAGWTEVPEGLLFFEMLTPCHDPVRKKALLESWALAPFKLFNPMGNFLKIPFICFCYKSPWTAQNQPIQEIKEYFGVKIAMYFLFIGHMMQWLWAPAILGVFILGYAAFRDLENEFKYDTPFSPYYSVFLVLWATFFLEFWKRKRFQYTVDWGTSDYENEAVYRKKWLQQYEELEGTDDPDEVDLLKANVLETRWCYLTSDYWAVGMRFKTTMSKISIMCSICVVLITVIGILIYRAIAVAKADQYGQYFAGLLNGVSIMVLGSLYKLIAAQLTTWENHRTEIEHQDSLIAKTFLFEFCNQYSSLFYIAFGKRYFGPLIADYYNISIDTDCVNIGGENDDSLCTTTNYCFTEGESAGTCAACRNDDCMAELAVQLLMILFVKSILYKFIYLMIPIVKRWCQKKKAADIGIKNRTWFEEESMLPFYSDVTDEYKEIAIMYGYIVLFAAAFPLAPLVSLITTAIELRTDAYKILQSRRPLPEKVSDIGTWYSVFDNLASISVITNIGLICFTSNEGFVKTLSVGQRWAGIVIIEHAILALMWFLKFLVPDTSAKSLKNQYKIKSKLEYLHRTIRYKQYYKQVAFVDEINRDVDDICKNVDSGESCFSKAEMSTLKLDQMLRKEEQLDDESEGKKQNRPSIRKSLLDISRTEVSDANLKEDESGVSELINSLIETKGASETVSERLIRLVSLRHTIGFTAPSDISVVVGEAKEEEIRIESDTSD